MSGQRDGLATYLSTSTTSQSIDLETPAVALAIGAHPDDIEFGCGATLAKWAQQGAEIHIAILTDGRRGTWNREQDQVALALSRQDEARAAATVLGASPPTFLQQIDGELRATPSLIVRLVALLRSVRPTVLLTHDPWKRYRLHPDHRIAGEVVIDALVQARDESFWPELSLPATRPTSLLLFEADVEDHSEIIEEPHMYTKANALACHRSQYPSSYGLAIDSPNPEQEILTRLLAVASEPGSDLLVEHFKLITDL
ncbi:PIG-L deacetylase family protein [Ferrimicrobium acidiphilum]|uniref:PIG-L deacetylase family protein n=1 Tax=Ferrimicrobium acidiphilum TaxID=121039 RepID=UPI0023EF8C26|nr:PIG-L deacetylase family protein [Ferrimicrobium acidiphilum]